MTIVKDLLLKLGKPALEEGKKSTSYTKRKKSPSQKRDSDSDSESSSSESEEDSAEEETSPEKTGSPSKSVPFKSQIEKAEKKKPAPKKQKKAEKLVIINKVGGDLTKDQEMSEKKDERREDEKKEEPKKAPTKKAKKGKKKETEVLTQDTEAKQKELSWNQNTQSANQATKSTEGDKVLPQLEGSKHLGSGFDPKDNTIGGILNYFDFTQKQIASQQQKIIDMYERQIAMMKENYELKLRKK